MWQQSSCSRAMLLRSVGRAMGLLPEMGIDCLFMSIQSNNTVQPYALSTHMIVHMYESYITHFLVLKQLVK